MVGVVEADAANRAHVRGRERREEQANVGYLVGDMVLAKDVAMDDSGGFGARDVGDAAREDGVAVVGSSVAGEESNEALRWLAEEL